MKCQIKILLWLILLNFFKTATAQSEKLQLPIIRIDTKGIPILDEPRINANLAVFAMEDSSNPQVYSQIEIETRGNTAQYFPKKCYGLKTITTEGENNNINLLGMPSEHDWVLYASYSDKTFIRDGLSYSIFRQMGHYAPRARHCKLYINDEYQGIYILTEKIKIDSKRVDISKSGVLLELTDLKRIKKDEPYFESKICKRAFVIKNPSNPDEPSIIQAKNIINKFEAIITSKNFADLPLDSLADIVNINSIIDYFLLNEAIRNVDVMYVSTFWHIDRSGKLTLGPLWDCDITLGNANYIEGWKTDGLYAVTRFYGANLYTNKEFKNLLHKRWSELRTNILSTSSVIGVIDSILSVVVSEVEKNNERWNTIGRYITPNYFIGQSYEEEIFYLKSWIINRLNWIDYAFFESKLYVDSTTSSLHAIAIYVKPSNKSLTVNRSSDGHSYNYIGRIDPFDTIFIDTLLRDNSLYYYSISEATGNEKNSIVAWTPLAVPEIPDKLEYVFDKDSSIILKWSDCAHNESYYVVETTNFQGKNQLDTLPADSQLFQTNLNTCNSFRVYACNRAGQSGYSNSLQIIVPDFNIDIFPTVVNSYFSININGLPSGTVRITVLDQLGRINNHTSLYKTNYLFSYIFEMDKYSAGQYSVYIEYNDTVEVFTVIKK